VSDPSAARHLIVYCTCPPGEKALDLAEALVQERLAACVNVLAGVTSFFHWEDKLQTAAEFLLVIKTRADRYAELEARIRELHPYELPEIVAVPIEAGLPDYLQWIDRETTA